MRSERDGVVVEGFAGAPSLTRANALGQYLFVNGRPVRDKLIIGAVRAAYSDYLPRDRHPVLALFVTLDPREVDANVHPAKTEVRFRDAGLVRALIVHALKDGLAREGQRSAAASVDGATSRRSARASRRRAANWDWRRSPSYPIAGRAAMDRRDRHSPSASRPASTSARRAPMCAATRRRRPIRSTVRSARRARRSTRPISWRRPATASSIVDQHAAHERWSMRS